MHRIFGKTKDTMRTIYIRRLNSKSVSILRKKKIMMFDLKPTHS